MSGKSLFKTAGLIAIITIISKLVGFVRDIIIAKAYGASMVSDAYFYAYQIPAFAIILLGGLGGPFHTATIAVFSKKIADLTKKPEEEVQKLLNCFITITGMVFLVLTVLVFFFSEPIIKVIAANANPQLQHLASMQLKIMSPIMFIGGVVGILYGISNVYKEFIYTSLSPTIASIAVIAAILMFNNDSTGAVLAWSTLIGSVGQLLLQLPVFFKSGFGFKPALFLNNPDILKIKEILFPAMIGTTIGQINIYVDMFFASRLPEGAWSAIGYANRIFQFPVGILITAMLVPLFPMFSGFVAKKEWESLRHYFKQGLMSLWYVSFPILAMIIIFSNDAIKLLLQRGKFTHSDTLMVSEALIFLSLSIIPYMARDTLTRVFYAFDDSKTPFYIALFSIIVKASMNLLFINNLGIGAITLSTTAVTAVNCTLLAIFIGKKVNLTFKELILPTVKVISATVLMSLVLILLRSFLGHIMPDNTLYLVIKIGICGIIGAVIYFILSLIFKISAAESLMARLNRFMPINKNNVVN